MAIKVVNKYKEPNHIYCGRGSALGNPFPMNNESKRDEVCDKYKSLFHSWMYKTNPTEEGKKARLMVNKIIEKALVSDVNLGCFCAPKRCHCDTIKEYIDKELSLLHEPKDYDL